MKVVTGILPILLLLLFSHCESRPIRVSQEPDYLIFGHFYGECVGEGCIEIFKIAHGTVFEDSWDRLPSVDSLPHPTRFVKMANNKYTQVKFLLERIPNELFGEKTVVVGQPDAGDWGGYYVETEINGTRRYWLIDKNPINLPDYLRGFVGALEDALQKLTTP